MEGRKGPRTKDVYAGLSELPVRVFQVHANQKGGGKEQKKVPRRLTPGCGGSPVQAGELLKIGFPGPPEALYLEPVRHR